MKMVELVGNTPLVFLGNILDNQVYAKLEYYNPTGSIKDRVAFNIVTEAIRRGEIREGATIVEATSGNTGIGLSFIAKQYDCKAIIFMPENMSKERRDLIKFYGADVVLTPADLGMQGAVKAMNDYMVGKTNILSADQFNNPDNWKAHYFYTAKEIFSQEKDLRYIVASIGSGGTIIGIKKYVMDNNIDCEVVGVEPEESPLITKGFASKHGIQGIGANFIPSIFDKRIIDSMVTVNTVDSYKGAKELANEFGINAGISSGATFMGVKKYIKTNNLKNQKILFIVPDNGIRYLSCGIYE